ncbi:membrane protein [Streptomyces sp. PRh5]|uniref:MFS transporter n=1 Tax=Streptomyces sp. PRh5 TaxID=1158056 RepID=UPI000446DD9B|nr:MFS transporter [Streptomyces sp. PRh5]EXU62644.1 membrane protein [Streptomyces sp. PRh5]
MRDILRLLRVSNIRRYLGGLVLSLFGSTSLTIASGIWVKTLTGSNSLAALATFCAWLPQLFAPAIGVIVDRARRRTVLILTNLAMVPVLAPLILVQDESRIWLIYLVMLGYGVSFTLIGAAEPALLTALLDPEDLGRLNSLRMFLQEGMKLVAPLAGAGLFALSGGGAVAGLAMGCFALAALCTSLIKVAETTSTAARASWLAETVAGLRYLRSQRTIRSLVLPCSLVMLVFGFVEAGAYGLVSDGLHRPPEFLGTIMALSGAGTLIGSMLAPWIMRRRGEPALTAIGMLVFAFGIVLLSTGSMAPVVAGAVVHGAGVPLLIVGVLTYIQKAVAPEMLGRVLATSNALLFSPVTFGIAAGAGLVAVLSYRNLFWIMAAIGLSAGLWLLTRRLPAATPVTSLETT